MITEKKLQRLNWTCTPWESKDTVSGEVFKYRDYTYTISEHFKIEVTCCTYTGDKTEEFEPTIELIVGEREAAVQLPFEQLWQVDALAALLQGKSKEYVVELIGRSAA